MKTFCTQCGFSCRLVREVNEIYPGQYATAYLSDCCREEVADWQGQPFKYGELARQYEDQKSWEVDE
jgi:hypothetical protein